MLRHHRHGEISALFANRLEDLSDLEVAIGLDLSHDRKCNVFRGAPSEASLIASVRPGLKETVVLYAYGTTTKHRDRAEAISATVNAMRGSFLNPGR